MHTNRKPNIRLFQKVRKALPGIKSKMACYVTFPKYVTMVYLFNNNMSGAAFESQEGKSAKWC